MVYLLPTARGGNVFTGVCLSAIGLMDTGLLTARSVRILLECFLVFEDIDNIGLDPWCVARIKRLLLVCALRIQTGVEKVHIIIK